MVSSKRRGVEVWHLFLLLLLLAVGEAGSGQVRYSVPEEAKHGTFVGRITQDLGLELAELVPRLFRVASKGRRDLLEVNLQNGILFVNSRIDREELCGRSAECSIHLEVIVDRPLQVFHVEVEVKDINDNPPAFPVAVKTIRFPESRLLDSRFPLEGAFDADIGVNALLTYKLSSSEFFFLDVQTNDELSQSLSLVLRKSLDREETAEINLLLVATDGGKPELTGTVQLLIKVLDVNDNEPTFDQSVYKIQLLENVANGTLVIKLNSSDADEGSNSEIMYSFSSDVSPNIKTKFNIDPSSGEIRTKGQLDYEDVKFYEIQVIAYDNGNPSMSGHCKISVKLVDINDNSPEVSITSLSLPIREDAPLGTVIALITVADRDYGANGQVTCTLSPHVPFRLVSTFRNYYSLVLDSTLDREKVSVYKLAVTAQDGGSPSLSTTASVSVEVADVNDNAPAFAQPEYTVFVKENNPPGCHIFTVSARDADAQENALVSYSLVERRVGERALSSYVSVHAESGKVYALQPLDHEELELLQFQAPKASSRALSGAAGAETALVDVNVYLIVAICAVSSLLVLTLLLYTALRCSAPPSEGACGPGKPRLVCSSAVGSWSYSQERQQRVCSGEGPPKTDLMAFSPSLPACPVVMDMGEHQDLKDDGLSKMYSILGDLGNRHLLLFFISLSIWMTASGQVRYSVLEEAKHGTFVGRIAQDLGLELEELVPRLFRVASKDLGDLLEVIVDRPLQVFHVEVEVKDINDNPPVFQGTQKNLFIAESRPLDSRFPLEGASDADIGENALLTYRLSSSEYFSLDVPTTDQQVKPLSLVLRKPLDREESPELHLVLTATDRGKPELTGTVQLLIHVLDVNDNAPVFDRTLYAVKLAENVPNGTLVIKLNASDLDEGLNADIIYSFSSDASPDVKFKFYIDPVSGEITVTEHIDFEERKTYKIRVEATDKGYPPLAGHCTVLVEVLDVNDNPPVLTVTSLSLPISENAQPGTVITLINVSDRDSGANGQVTCSLTPHVPFKLVSTFKNYYSLVLDSALDRESVANYEVVLQPAAGGARSPFRVGLYTGEISTTRALDEADAPRQRLLVLERRQRVCSGEGPPKTDLMAFSPSLPPLPPGLDREVEEERKEVGSNHSGLSHDVAVYSKGEKGKLSPSPDSNNPQNRIDSILTGKLGKIY
ncbi:unnamed protein product [Rangifer tarandus platyrhynchus]|uniref:Cadherin domain-containing protein n=1 Tax=Rangifer tarandus platyrhynchus TaxID=3082113 RepID=A0ABN8Z9L6_RANTA|nr:unnamed protein product [Rangifer tarandus platyrhynchus]